MNILLREGRYSIVSFLTVFEVIFVILYLALFLMTVKIAFVEITTCAFIDLLFVVCYTCT
jgi:hypothetical protein